MDVKDCSSEDKLMSHAELLSENRRQRGWLARKIKELNTKEESKKAKNPEEQYRRDTLDQKTFTYEFTGKDLHMMFLEDLRIKTLTHQNWRDLIKIKTDKSEHNLLHKYILLTYEELVGSKNLRQSNKISTSRNMYIAIWWRLDFTPKQHICSYLSKINGDGPTLLWYILTLYHGTAAQIICGQQKKF